MTNSTPVYEIVAFKWVAEDDSFEVRVRLGCAENKKTWYLPNNPTSEPLDGYQRPSTLLYMGPKGIGWASKSMRVFQGMPDGARHCYQCEYDEYIWKQIEEGKMEKTERNFYNWAVWDAYLEWQKCEESGKELIDAIFAARAKKVSATKNADVTHVGE